ncbi:MAG: nucleotidyltransferase domain-containing protein [Desulfobacteraceae bacterium]|nr:nucleotidyltransferase domain-containing protein [Desulfobacteraceae bacterium]
MKPCNLTSEKREKILASAAAKLDLHHEVCFAFAHGSFVQGGAFRDLDVAVFLLPKILPEIGFRYEMRMESEIEKALDPRVPVDVRILNTAKLGFQYQVLRGHLLVDRDPDERVAFTRKTVARYLDIAPLLRHHTKEAFSIEPRP